MLKLYEVTVLDDMDDIVFLKVSDKTISKIKKEIENDDSYSCFMWCSVREIEEVDGHKIIVCE
ncbi:MAG: hypothetical protein E6356_14095 [Terrisporobacter othiniensis]|nr:hypothetical protein [Terrisporobacter othiniensis]